VSALLGAGGLAKLESLALARHPGLDAKALPMLLDAPFVGQLHTLALTELDFGAKGCKALAKAELGTCTQLELRGTKLGKQAAEIVANPTLKRLVRLGLDGTKIGAKLLGDLLAAIDLPELRCLRLGQLRCKAEGAEAIAASDVFTRCGIVELDLGGNAIADEGAEALAKAEGLAGIRRLSLQANGIRVDGIEALQDSPLFHGLEVLALGNNKIQTKGATALASSALAASLRELDIDHNWIGNKGVAALLGHKGKGLLGLEKIVFGYENNFAFAGLETLVDSPIRLRDLNAGHFGDTATLAAYLGSPAASELRRLVTYFGVEPSLAGEIARGELAATLHTFSCQFAVADEALLDALAKRFAFALQRLEWGLSMW